MDNYDELKAKGFESENKVDEGFYTENNTDGYYNYLNTLNYEDMMTSLIKITIRASREESDFINRLLREHIDVARNVVKVLNQIQRRNC